MARRTYFHCFVLKMESFEIQQVDGQKDYVSFALGMDAYIKKVDNRKKKLSNLGSPMARVTVQTTYKFVNGTGNGLGCIF